MSKWASASAYLVGLSADSEALGERARARFASLSTEQLSWRPAPASWSVGECLEHLVTMNRLYIGRIDRLFAGAIAKAIPDAGFRGGPVAARFIAAMGPDSARKFKAPSVFKPSAPGAGGDVDPGIVERFIEQQAYMKSVMERCRGVDLRRAKVRSPVSGLIRFRLGDALRLLVEHGKRHLNQAEAVLASDGCPSS